MSQDGPALLVVDDNEDNLYTLTQRLRREGYTNVGTARDGRQALELLRARPFDLVLLDVMMPEVNGYQVLEALKADDGLRSIPVIMISAVDELESVIRCVELGAADYLPKPFNPVLLRARIGACLEKKRLHDRLLEWSRTLEERVREKVAEVERLGRLKRFFSPHLAELIVAGGAEDPLKTHRREITVVFLDLRGFSTFAETTEPEEVMGVLHEYHAAMGQLILEHEGTLERFTGDGMMIFFNDPVPVPQPAERAIRMAIAMRERGPAAQRRVAEARPRPRAGRRDRRGLRDHRRHRVRGALGLRRHRHGDQSRRAPLRRGQGRPDPRIATRGRHRRGR